MQTEQGTVQAGLEDALRPAPVAVQAGMEESKLKRWVWAGVAAVLLGTAASYTLWQQLPERPPQRPVPVQKDKGNDKEKEPGPKWEPKPKADKKVELSGLREVLGPDRQLGVIVWDPNIFDGAERARLVSSAAKAEFDTVWVSGDLFMKMPVTNRSALVDSFNKAGMRIGFIDGDRGWLTERAKPGQFSVREVEIGATRIDLSVTLPKEDLAADPDWVALPFTHVHRDFATIQPAADESAAARLTVDPKTGSASAVLKTVEARPFQDPKVDKISVLMFPRARLADVLSAYGKKDAPPATALERATAAAGPVSRTAVFDLNGKVSGDRSARNHYRALTRTASKHSWRYSPLYATDVEEYLDEKWNGNVGEKLDMFREDVLPYIREVRRKEKGPHLWMFEPSWLENGVQLEGRKTVVKGWYPVDDTAIASMTYVGTAGLMAERSLPAERKAEQSLSVYMIGGETLKGHDVPALSPGRIGPVLEGAVKQIAKRDPRLKHLGGAFVHTDAVNAKGLIEQLAGEAKPAAVNVVPAAKFAIKDGKPAVFDGKEIVLELQLSKAELGNLPAGVIFQKIIFDLTYITPYADRVYEVELVEGKKDFNGKITLGPAPDSRPLKRGEVFRTLVALFPAANGEKVLAAYQAAPPRTAAIEAFRAAGPDARLFLLNRKDGTATDVTKEFERMLQAGLEETSPEDGKMDRREFLWKTVVGTGGALLLANGVGRMLAQEPAGPRPVIDGPANFRMPVGQVDRKNTFLTDWVSGDFYPPKWNMLSEARGMRAARSWADAFINQWDAFIKGAVNLGAKLIGRSGKAPTFEEIADQWGEPGRIGKVGEGDQTSLRSYIIWAPWQLQDEQWWPVIFDGARRAAGVPANQPLEKPHSRIYLDPYGVISPFRPWDVSKLARLINTARRHGVEIVPLLGDPGMAQYPTSAIYLMRALLATGAIVPDKDGVTRFSFDIEPIGLDEYEEFDKKLKELKAEIERLERQGRDASEQKRLLEQTQADFDLKQKEWWENIFYIATDAQEKLFHGFQPRSFKGRRDAELSFFVPPEFFDLAQRMDIKVPPGVHLKVMAYSNKPEQVAKYMEQVKAAFAEDSRRPPERQRFRGVTYSTVVDIGPHRDTTQSLWRDENGEFSGKVGDRTRDVGEKLDEVLPRGTHGSDGERIVHTHSIEDLIWFFKEGGPPPNEAANAEMQEYFKRGAGIIKEMAEFLSAQIKTYEHVPYRAFVNGKPVAQKAVRHLQLLLQRISSGAVGTGAMLAHAKSVRDTMVRYALAIDRDAYLFGSDLGIIHSLIGVKHSENFGQDARIMWLSRTVVDPAAIGFPVRVEAEDGEVPVLRLTGRLVTPAGEVYEAGTLIVKGTVLPAGARFEETTARAGDVVLGTKLLGEREARKGDDEDQRKIIPGRTIHHKDDILADGKNDIRKQNDLLLSQLPTASYDIYWSMKVENLSATQGLKAFVQLRPHTGFGEAHDIQTKPIELAAGGSTVRTVDLRIGFDDYGHLVEPDQRTVTNPFRRKSRLLHNLPVAEAAFLISEKAGDGQEGEGAEPAESRRWGEIAHAVGVVHFDPNALNYTLRDRRYRPTLQRAARELIEREQLTELSLHSIHRELGEQVLLPRHQEGRPVDLEGPRRLAQEVARRRYGNGATHLMLQSEDLMDLVRLAMGARHRFLHAPERLDEHYKQLAATPQAMRVQRFLDQIMAEGMTVGIKIDASLIADMVQGQDRPESDPDLMQEFFTSLSELLEHDALFAQQVNFLVIGNHRRAITREEDRGFIARKFLNAEDFRIPLMFMGPVDGIEEVRDPALDRDLRIRWDRARAEYDRVRPERERAWQAYDRAIRAWYDAGQRGPEPQRPSFPPDPGPAPEPVVYSVPVAQDLSGLSHEQVMARLEQARRENRKLGMAFFTQEQADRARRLRPDEAEEIVRRLIGELPDDPEKLYSQGGTVTSRWLNSQLDIPRSRLSVFSRLIRDTMELSTVSPLTSGHNDPQFERRAPDETRLFYFRLRVSDVNGQLLKVVEFATSPLQFDLNDVNNRIRGYISGLEPGHRYSISMELAPGMFVPEQVQTPIIAVEGQSGPMPVNRGSPNKALVGPHLLDFGDEEPAVRRVNGADMIIDERWSVKTESGEVLYLGRDPTRQKLLWWTGEDGPVNQLEIPEIGGAAEATADLRLGEVPVRLHLQRGRGLIWLEVGRAGAVAGKKVELFSRVDLRQLNRRTMPVPLDIPPARPGQPSVPRMVEVEMNMTNPDQQSLTARVLPLNAQLSRLAPLASELPTAAVDTTREQVTPHSNTGESFGRMAALATIAWTLAKPVNAALDGIDRTRTRYRDQRIRNLREEQQKQAQERAARRAEARGEKPAAPKEKPQLTQGPVNWRLAVKKAAWAVGVTAVAGLLAWFLIPMVPVLVLEPLAVMSPWGFVVKLIGTLMVGGMGVEVAQAFFPNLTEKARQIRILWTRFTLGGLMEGFNGWGKFLSYAIIFGALITGWAPLTAALTTAASYAPFYHLAGFLAPYLIGAVWVAVTVLSFIVLLRAMHAWDAAVKARNEAANKAQEAIKMTRDAAGRGEISPEEAAKGIAESEKLIAGWKWQPLRNSINAGAGVLLKAAWWTGAVLFAATGSYLALGLFGGAVILTALQQGIAGWRRGVQVREEVLKEIERREGAEKRAAAENKREMRLTPLWNALRVSAPVFFHAGVLAGLYLFFWPGSAALLTVGQIFQGLSILYLGAGVGYLLFGNLLPAAGGGVLFMSIPSILGYQGPNRFVGSDLPNPTAEKWQRVQEIAAFSAMTGFAGFLLFGSWVPVAVMGVLGAVALGFVFFGKEIATPQGDRVTANTAWGRWLQGKLSGWINETPLMALAGFGGIWFLKALPGLLLSSGGVGALIGDILVGLYAAPQFGLVLAVIGFGFSTLLVSKWLLRMAVDWWQARHPEEPFTAWFRSRAKFDMVTLQLGLPKEGEDTETARHTRTLAKDYYRPAVNELLAQGKINEEQAKDLIRRIEKEAGIPPEQPAVSAAGAEEPAVKGPGKLSESELPVLLEKQIIFKLAVEKANRFIGANAAKFGLPSGATVEDFAKKSEKHKKQAEDLVTALAFQLEPTKAILQMDVGAKFAQEPYPGQERTSPPLFAMQVSQLVSYLYRSKSSAVFPGIYVFPSFDVNQFDLGLRAFGTPIVFFSQAMNYYPSMIVRAILSLEEGSQPRMMFSYVRSDMEPDLWAYASEVQGRWEVGHKMVLAFAEMTGRRFVWDPDNMKPKSFARMPGPLHSIFELMKKSKDPADRLAAQYDMLPTLTNLWYQVGEMPPFGGFDVLRYNDETDDPGTNISDSEAAGDFNPDPGVKIIRLHGRRSFNDSWLHGSIAVEFGDNGKPKISDKPSKFKIGFGPSTPQNPKSSRMALALGILHGIYWYEPDVDKDGNLKFKTFTPQSQGAPEQLMKTREKMFEEQKKAGEPAREVYIKMARQLNVSAAGAEEKAWAEDPAGARDPKLGWAVSDSRRGAIQQGLYRLVDVLTMRRWAFSNTEAEGRPTGLGWKIWERLKAAVIGGVTGFLTGWVVSSALDAGITGGLIGGAIGAAYGLIFGLQKTARLWYRVSPPAFIGTVLFLTGAIGWIPFVGSLLLSRYFLDPVFRSPVPVSYFGFRSDPQISAFRYDYDPAHLIDLVEQATGNWVRRPLGKLTEAEVRAGQAELLRRGLAALKKVENLYEWSVDLGRGLSPDRWDENPNWSEADWERYFISLISPLFQQVPEEDKTAAQHAMLALLQGHRAAAGQERELVQELYYGSHDAGVPRLGDVNRVMTWFREHSGRVATHARLPELGGPTLRQVNARTRSWAWTAHPTAVGGIRVSARLYLDENGKRILPAADNPLGRLLYRGSAGIQQAFVKEGNVLVLVAPVLRELMNRLGQKPLDDALKNADVNLKQLDVNRIEVVSDANDPQVAGGQRVARETDPVEAYLASGSNQSFNDWLLFTESSLEPDTDTLVRTRAVQARQALQGPRQGPQERKDPKASLNGVRRILGIPVVSAEMWHSGMVRPTGQPHRFPVLDGLLYHARHWLDRLGGWGGGLLGAAVSAGLGTLAYMVFTKSLLVGAAALPFGIPAAVGAAAVLGGAAALMLVVSVVSPGSVGPIVNRGIGLAAAAGLGGLAYWAGTNALTAGGMILPYLVPGLGWFLGAVLVTAAALQLYYSVLSPEGGTGWERVRGVAVSLGLAAGAWFAVVSLPAWIGAIPAGFAMAAGYISMAFLIYFAVRVGYSTLHSSGGMDGYTLDNWVDQRWGLLGSGDGLRSLSLVPGLVSWLFSQVMLRLVFSTVDKFIPAPYPHFSVDAHLLASDLDDSPSMFQGLVHNVSYPRWFGSLPPGLPALKVVLWQAFYWWNTTPVPATVALRLANGTPGIRELTEANYGSSGKMGRESIVTTAVAEDTRLNEVMGILPVGLPSSPAVSLWLEPKLLYEYFRLRDSDDDLIHRSVLFAKGMDMEHTNLRLRTRREDGKEVDLMGEIDQMPPDEQAAFFISLESYLQSVGRNEVAVGGRAGSAGVYSYLFTAFTAHPLYLRLVGLYAAGEIEAMLWFTMFAWLDRQRGGALARQLEQMQIDRGDLQGPARITRELLSADDPNAGTLFDPRVRRRLLQREGNNRPQLPDPRTALAMVWLMEANMQAELEDLGLLPEDPAQRQAFLREAFKKIEPLRDTKDSNGRPDMVYTQSRRLSDYDVVTLHGMRLWPPSWGGREMKETDAHPHLRSINRIMHRNGKSDIILLSEDALLQLAQIVDARPWGTPEHTEPLTVPAENIGVPGTTETVPGTLVSKDEPAVRQAAPPEPAAETAVPAAETRTQPPETRQAGNEESPEQASAPAAQPPFSLADRLPGMSPAELRALMDQLRAAATGLENVDAAIAAQGLRVELRQQAARNADAAMNAASGVYMPAETPNPVVFLFDHPDTLAFAPQVAKTGAPVALLVEELQVAAGMEELFRRAGIEQGRYAIVSREEHGWDEAAAMKALSARFPAGVSFVPVPAGTTLAEVERFLNEYGIVFYSDAAAGVEEVERYLGSLA